MKSQMETSQSTSATPSVELDFSIEDLLVAKITVRELIRRGARKGPSDLLMLPDHLIEQWYEEDARRFLQENKARRLVS